MQNGGGEQSNPHTLAPAAYVPVECQLPAVHLHPHADPAWFPPGVKHKWVLDGGGGGQGRD